MGWSLWDTLDLIPIVGEVARLGQGITLGVQGKWDEAGEAFANMGVNLAGDALGLVTGGAGKVGVTAGRIGVKAVAKEGVVLAEHAAVDTLEKEGAHAATAVVRKAEVEAAELALAEAKAAEREALWSSRAAEYKKIQARKREKLDVPDIAGTLENISSFFPSSVPEDVPLTDESLTVIQNEGATKHRDKHKSRVLMQPGADPLRALYTESSEASPVKSSTDITHLVIGVAVVGATVYVLYTLS